MQLPLKGFLLMLQDVCTFCAHESSSTVQLNFSSWHKAICRTSSIFPPNYWKRFWSSCHYYKGKWAAIRLHFKKQLSSTHSSLMLSVMNSCPIFSVSHYPFDPFLHFHLQLQSKYLKFHTDFQAMTTTVLCDCDSDLSVCYLIPVTQVSVSPAQKRETSPYHPYFYILTPFSCFS